MREQESTKKEIIDELIKSFSSGKLSDGSKEPDQEKESYGEEHIIQLQKACNNLLKKNLFQVGQLVKWKENLKNRKLPYQNQPAIVVEILAEPITNNQEESGSTYFGETLDIILGILVEDTFLTFYYDRRRFEPY
jgi:hypothetical protein